MEPHTHFLYCLDRTPPNIGKNKEEELGMDWRQLLGSMLGRGDLQVNNNSNKNNNKSNNNFSFCFRGTLA